MLYPRLLTKVWVQTLFTCCLVSAAASGALAAEPKAKKTGPELEKVSGKVSAVEPKGKATKVTVDVEGGEPLEIVITPKIALHIVGDADSELFKPNQYVSAEATMAGDKLTTKEVTVHLGTSPQPRLVKDPKTDGAYQAGGAIVSFEKDTLTINFGPAGGARKLMLEEDAKYRFLSSDPSLVTVGAPVDVEGLTRNGKLHPSQVTVQYEGVLTADKWAPGSKKTVAKKTPRTSKKSAAPSAENPPGDAAAGSSDIFGLGNADAKTDAKKSKKADKKSKDQDEMMEKPQP